MQKAEEDTNFNYQKKKVWWINVYTVFKKMVSIVQTLKLETRLGINK